MEVHYLTEDPAKEYAKAVDAAGSLAELKRTLAPRSKWSNVAPDAIALVKTMTEDEWPVFRDGLMKERKNKPAGEAWWDRYMAVLLPEKMLKASLMANQFQVPWGTAFIRLRERDRSDDKASEDES